VKSIEKRLATLEQQLLPPSHGLMTYQEISRFCHLLKTWPDLKTAPPLVIREVALFLIRVDKNKAFRERTGQKR
jgi:hypothetical protein